MSVLAKSAKIGYKLGRSKRYKRWEPKGPRVIIDVTLDRGKHDPTPQQCDHRGPLGQRQERVSGTMVTVPHVFQVKPHKIVYAYDRWQPRFDRMQKKEGIQFHRGLPDPRHLTQWFGRTRGGVLVLDDLMEEGGQDKRVLDLFTKDSHHRNITVLYLTQDLFPPGKFSKTINRNAHYIVAFKNPRDQTGIRTILLQAFPDR